MRRTTPEEDERDESLDEVVPLNGARLRAEIAALLLLPPENIDDQQNLIELGLDSVAVMMLASRFYAQGVEVELNELLEEPTIGAWSALLSRR